MFNIKTNSPVNIRSGPGMGFDVNKTYPSDHVLLSSEVKTDGGGNTWYKVNGGWLSSNYAVEVQEQVKPNVNALARSAGTSFFNAGGTGTGGASLTTGFRESSSQPATDAILRSSIHAQRVGILGSPNGGLSSSVFTGNRTQGIGSDGILNRRIYGTPYQFMETTDYRPGSAPEGAGLGDKELGSHFMEMMAEAPILSIIPGKANFLPDVDEKTKAEVVNAFETQAAKFEEASDDALRQDIAKTMNVQNADMRYFEFLSDHATYIRYVNILCRMNAVMMGIGDEYVPGYEDSGMDSYKFKNYDWSGYRLSNSMAGRPSQSSALPSNSSNAFQSIQDFGNYLANSYNAAGGGIEGAFAAISALNLQEYYIDFYINPSIGYSETFSNGTKESMIASAVGQLGDLSKELGFLLGAGAVRQDGNMAKSSAKFIDEVGNAADGLLGGNTFVKKVIGNASSILSGSNIFFPELWGSSDFSRSYSVEIDLKTPYGNKKNIFLDLFVPMWHWIALAAPRQTTINTYSSPFICRAYIPGMFSSEMSIVESLTIQKGGDGSAWSVDGYPLEIKLQINLKDLYNSFSISKINTSQEAYNMLWNHALIDYVSVQSGVNMKQSEYAKKMKVAEALSSSAIRDLYQYPLDSIRESLSRGLRIAAGKT